MSQLIDSGIPIKWNSLSALLLVLTIACTSSDPEKEAESVKRSYEAYLPEVSVVQLEKQEFSKELNSNGTLTALRKAELRSEVSGFIKAAAISEGQRITSGSEIIRLDNTESLQNLSKSQISYDKAIIDLEDMVLSFNGGNSDTTNMASELLHNLKIKSGFATASMELEIAKDELKKTRIRAPFTGRVADLEVKPFNYVNTGDEICKLIDDSKFEVIFPVIESELLLLQMGQQVQVTPYAVNASYMGVISAINPVVNENGLIYVTALINNTDGKLIEGLNVRVTLQRQVTDQLVIPKEALLQRDGRKVVFTLREDSTAYWNYVEVGFENADSYTITDGLKEDEWIIVEGNINLAHETKVMQKSAPGSANQTAL